jgi:hypothetical protein
VSGRLSVLAVGGHLSEMEVGNVHRDKQKFADGRPRGSRVHPSRHARALAIGHSAANKLVKRARFCARGAVVAGPRACPAHLCVAMASVSNFMKIRHVGAELFHVDRRTDGQTSQS